MSIKDTVVNLLTAGVEIDVRCEECGAEFTESEGVCPECGSTEFTEIQP